MARNCPDCREQLNPEHFHGVHLDVCLGCAGLWFDPQELRRLITSDPLAVVALDDHIVQEIKQGTGAVSHPIHALHCPDCSMPLEAFHYEYSSPVQMNACPDCGGFWMLEQELRKLEQWLEQERHALEDPKVKERLQLAEIQMQHDEVMRRQQNVGRLLRLLQTRVPHWIPFLPIS